MNPLLVLPVVIPLFVAVALMLTARSLHLQRWVSVAGSALLLLVAGLLLVSVWRNGVQAGQLGAWPAPFGITLVADLFSAIMVLLTGIMAFTMTLYSLATMDHRRERFGYHPLVHFLLMGVAGAFLTGDMFNLYVWFEVMLIASFVLLALGGERPQMEGAVKYVTLNLIASVMFLSGVGILYGVVGTLNMADLSVKLAQTENAGVITAVAMLIFVAFGVKAAVFPLFFWLPAAYHTPPVVITALFSGLLTKAGVYAMVRVFTLMFTHDVSYTHTIILVAGGLTMVTGVLGAVAQMEVRRLLSFHIVSQIGYLLMGLGLFTPLALAGAIYFIVHVSIAKAALFLVSGVAHWLLGTYDLKKMGGLYKAHPGLAVLFLLPALSLAGIPPLSGFFAKLALVRAGLEVGQYAIVAVALVVSILTLYSMIKIWTEVFWKVPEEQPQLLPAGASTGLLASPGLLFAPIVVLSGLTLLMGVAAEPAFSLAMTAAEQLLDPAAYRAAVLGEGL